MPGLNIEVFIQNEAGSNRKNYHDEKTLEYKFTKLVSRTYPYPYGFIIGTTNEDGGNVDCFVITNQPLKTGQKVACAPIALMEQVEDGKSDHNVLAVLSDEISTIGAEVHSNLVDFVSHVFDHMKGKQIIAGRFWDREEAEAYITTHLDRP